MPGCGMSLPDLIFEAAEVDIPVARAIWVMVNWLSLGATSAW